MKVCFIASPLSMTHKLTSIKGSNFSAGEKQLLALCRALVKNSRIIVLVSRRVFLPLRIVSHYNILKSQDEATSSVDVETDAKLQRTIQTEFATSTLLCIAHRLNTIGNISILYTRHRSDTNFSLLRSHSCHGWRENCRI